MKKYKATDPEMIQAQKDLAKMSNLSDRVITNDKDLKFYYGRLYKTGLHEKFFLRPIRHQ